MNLGNVTGKGSGHIVIDIDPKSGGAANLIKAQLIYGEFPPGPHVKTGGGGDHFYFAYPTGLDHVPNRTALGGFSGIDVRGDRGFVVAPPSIHPNGTRYTWMPGLALGEVDLPPLPRSWLELIVSGNKAGANENGPACNAIREGTRNDTLFRRACAMRAQGAERDEILETLRTLNLSCVPPMEEDELWAIADSAAKYPPNIPFTDLGNARRLVAQHGQDIRFCIETGKWLVWTGKNWSQDHNA